MKYLFLIIISVALSSCAFTYRTTKFTPNDMYIGMDKELVLKTFGTPFKSSRYVDQGKNMEILHYKEIVEVMAYDYDLTTILLFENSKLIKITQEDERIQDVTIKK